MTRSTVLLSALTEEPASTSELYQRVGYAELTRIGLVPYEAFRAELTKLSGSGLAQRGTDASGATTWRLATPSGEGSPVRPD